MNKHLIWVIGLIVIVSIICGTLIYLNNHPYIFEIGNNALEGIKAINWTALEVVN
jgi:hypothetical protein